VWSNLREWPFWLLARRRVSLFRKRCSCEEARCFDVGAIALHWKDKGHGGVPGGSIEAVVIC